MAAERTVRVRAPAKINVTLRVLGTRPDGYHELRTLFQTIALHDVVIVSATPGPVRIACTDPACPIDRTNLVWRAAEAVWAAAGRRGAPRDLRVRLVKRIPMAAGLGGGSSDAAATIGACAALWRVNLPETRARAIAVSLGADVPFFLEGGAALGVERGDVLFPLRDPPPAWVVLVIPRFGVSTKEAYEWFDEGGGGAPRDGGTAVTMSWLTRMPDRELINDLQRAVEWHHPEIARIAGALRRHGASYAAMSGSGSTVFGLCPTRAAALTAARALATRTRRAIVTRTLDRDGYRRLARPVVR